VLPETTLRRSPAVTRRDEPDDMDLNTINLKRHRHRSSLCVPLSARNVAVRGYVQARAIEWPWDLEARRILWMCARQSHLGGSIQ